jgi:DNA-binding MarR family transcriptional regulator
VTAAFPNEQETAIWVAMNRAHRAVHAEINAALKARGLPSLRWYDILWSIERQGGSLRPFELGKDMIFEQSNLSHQLRRIAEKGLIRFEVYEHDQRGRVLHITEEGRRLRAEMWEIYGPMLHERMKALAESEDGGELIRRMNTLAAPEG